MFRYVIDSMIHRTVDNWYVSELPLRCKHTYNAHTMNAAGAYSVCSVTAWNASDSEFDPHVRHILFMKIVLRPFFRFCWLKKNNIFLLMTKWSAQILVNCLQKVCSGSEQCCNHGNISKDLSKMTLIRKFHIWQMWSIGTNSSNGWAINEVWKLRFNKAF